MPKNLKILHLPTTVGGNPQGLSHYLNQVGVQSESWTLAQNYFGYLADRVICQPGDSRLAVEFKRIFALRYIFKCDLVFFNYGAGFFRPFFVVETSLFSRWLRPLIHCYCYYVSFFGFFEILLLRLRGVKIFIQYQGDDARQGDFSKKNFLINFAGRVDSSYYSLKTDEMKRKQIAYYAKFADRIYALNPDLLHLLPSDAEFLPYSHINLDDWIPTYNQLNNRPLRIGHAPSNRNVKGTDLLLAAVENLKREGFLFELVLVEGSSNSEAKDIYKTIDVLVDQLFAGWYGGLAVEAMALGKPVIAYIRDDDLHFIPAAMRKELPIIRAEPSSIQSVICQVLQMSKQELLQLAKRSRAYVEKWHDPLRIAERVKADIQQALCENA